MKRHLSQKDFKFLIERAPLISLDLCILHEKKILLGKRVNAPAKGYYFTPGGRIYKNEPWQSAIERILFEELGLQCGDLDFKLMGIWDHFYDDSVMDKDISTHYVNLPHFKEFKVKPLVFSDDQHENFEWFDIYESKFNTLIHPYVQKYIDWMKER